MADDLPDGRYEELEGAGHLSNLEASQAFDDLLEGHLKRCDLL
jgi:pimeloyl-ACP methyl ester carboxylesterase